MVDALIKIFIGILVVLTLFIGVKQPKMHNTIQIYDSSFTTTVVPEDNKQEKTVKKEIVELPSKEITKKEQVVEKKEVKTPVKQETVKQVQVKKEVKKEPVKQVQTKSPTVKAESNKTVNKVQTQTKTVEAPKPTVSTTVKKEEKVVEEKMSQEELIAWNVWHSNIQNSLMRDVKMPYIPDGIIFKFSFTVDKYGKITNINTYSTTPKYTPYAIEYIAPVIRSYQGKSILEFPSNSKRAVTNFTGGWKMSSGQSRYSSPSDYNDVEKVIK